MTRLAWNFTLVVCLAVGNAFAEEKPVSKVRQAAIEKMQAKLGSLRGTIKEDSPTLFLTDTMLDKLKPIQPGANVTNSVSDLKEIGSKYLDINVPTVDTANAPSNMTPSELLRAAGYKPDDQS